MRRLDWAPFVFEPKLMREKRAGFLQKMASGQLDWVGMFSRYVWDTETTPYFVPVKRLTRTQVVSEIRVYAIILGIAALIFSLAYLAGKITSVDSFAVAFYCFVVACAALILGVMRVEPAAWVVATFPAMGIVKLASSGFTTGHSLADRLGMMLLFALILWYTWRIIRITRHEPLPDPVKRS